MLVHFVTDEPTKIPAIRAMLEPRHHVVPQLLGGGDTQSSSNGVLMVDADLRKIVRVEQIRLVLQELNCIPEKLFVVQNHVRSIVAQAYALGATAVVSRPREIIFKLAQIEVAEKAAQTDFAITSTNVNFAGMPVWLDTSSAAPVSDRSRTLQSIAPSPDSIVAAFEAR